MKKVLLASLAAGMLFSMTACDGDTYDPNNPQSVRKYMEKNNIPLTADKFIGYAASGDTAKMTLFLQATFEINEANAAGNNAVALAANKGNIVSLNYLFAHGATADVRNSAGETALENAVAMGNKDVVALLLEQLKKEGIEPRSFTPALISAAKSDRVEMIDILVDAGAAIDAVGADGDNPLHAAVKNGRRAAANKLVEKGANVNAQCNAGYSVLDWAMNSRYTNIIADMKKAGAKNTPKYLKDSKR